VTTPFQNFRLDLGSIANVISLIAIGTNLLPELAATLGMGERKVRDLFEWCHHLGLLVEKSRNAPQCLTNLGYSLSTRQGWLNQLSILDILYASLVARHKIVNRIVNELGYNTSLRFSPQFSMQEYRGFLVSLTHQVVDAKAKVVLDRGSTFLNALAQPSGFGKLMMFSLAEDRLYVRVQPRFPAWQSAAYILYDSWPENVSRVKISEVVSGPNSLGRIFFLTEPQVMVLLSKLEQERALALEIVADLNQIGLNPAMKAEGFLEMLIHDQG
jgi:hypothetical protein